MQMNSLSRMNSSQAKNTAGKPMLAACGLMVGWLFVAAGCSPTESSIADRPTVPPTAEAVKPSEPAELAFSEQVERVRTGLSREIRITQSKVASTELAELAGLTQLRVLVLDGGSVTDSDLPTIATLTGLEHLRIRESPLTDSALAELGRSELKSLAIFNAPQATPTALGLSQLGKLPLLRQLRIGGRQIDDSAVDELAKWPALTSLHLIGPKLTDRSLVTIASMPKLASFYLDDCPLSDAAWEDFFRKRPNLHVHVDQAHHDRDPGAH